MKIIKPRKLGLLYRVFEHDGRAHLIISAMVGFRFDAPRAVLSEQQIWLLAAEELAGERGVLDEGNLKPCGEVLITGKCFTPGGQPAPVSFVRVQISSVDKRLAVFGDRVFRAGAMSDAAPFVEMSVDWAHAFGGSNHPPNRAGKGAEVVEGPEGRVRPLPNVEVPEHLMVAPDDHPVPGGFGALDVASPQRMAHVGTYDDAWLRTRFPGVAADFDPAFFSTAPADQRLRDYFVGDEEFVVENMHPAEPRQSGKLPGGVVRAFVEKAGAPGLVEVPMRLDTVRLFPHRERGVLVYRGVFEVSEDDAADVATLLLGMDDPTMVRSVEHYAAIAAARGDKERGALHVLKDEDLMPPRELGWEPRPEAGELEKLVRPSGVRFENAARRREREMQEAEERLVRKGIDPTPFRLNVPHEEPKPPDPNDTDAVIAYVEANEKRIESEREKGAARRAELEANLRQACALRGVDYDRELEKARIEHSGPPKFKADLHIERLRATAAAARAGGAPLLEVEGELAAPGYREALLEQEKSMLERYRASAHYQYAAPHVDAEASARIRVEVELARDNDVSLVGRDLTGVDLSGLNLKGVDLRGALLESTVLSRTDLTDANLEGAVLAHARLDRTSFVRANLTRANLGAATIDEVDFSGADLTEAVLSGARVRAATFEGARLHRTQTVETKWEGIPDFTRVDASEMMFAKQDLTRARFVEAKLKMCVFMEVDAEEIDFSRATMTRVSFVKALAQGASFRGSSLDGVTFLEGTTLAGADFSDAILDGPLLMGLDLSGARFERARLSRANLSGSRLVGARLSRCVARDALFVRSDLSGADLSHADLLSAMLSKAKLFGTDLRGASLFRADLSRVQVDASTRLDDANTTQARLLPRSSHGPS